MITVGLRTKVVSQVALSRIQIELVAVEPTNPNEHVCGGGGGDGRLSNDKPEAPGSAEHEQRDSFK
jgi:hypothetical protein